MTTPCSIQTSVSQKLHQGTQLEERHDDRVMPMQYTILHDISRVDKE